MTQEQIYSEAKKVANSYMTNHGLSILGWKFQFDNGKRRFGFCSPARKLISLSLPLTILNWEARQSEVINTILHEIAHALTFIQYGNSVSAHGREWKRNCVKIGCKPEQYYEGEELNVPKGKYVYKCPHCEKEISFFREKKRMVACGACCKNYNFGKFSKDFVLVLVGEK